MKPFASIAAVTMCALALVSSAQAQVSTPETAVAVRLDLARQLIASTGGSAAMEAQMRSLFASVMKLSESALSTADPKVADVSRVTFNYIVDEEIKAIPAMVDQMAGIYADSLSERELRDALAWNLSPSGQSIRAKTPLMTQQLVAAQGPLMKKMMAGVFKTAVDRACSESHCTEAERTMLTQAFQKFVPAG